MARRIKRVRKKFEHLQGDLEASALFESFAQPLILNAGGASSKDEYDNLLQIAAMAWNICVQAEVSGDDSVLDRQRDLLEENDLGALIMPFDMLVTHKKEHFSEHRFGIERLEVYRDGDEVLRAGIWPVAVSTSQDEEEDA